jgi:hypothetical protein
VEGIVRDISHGKYYAETIADENVNAASRLTMGKLCERFLREILEVRARHSLGGAQANPCIKISTARVYRDFLQRHILPQWGSFALADFEKSETWASVDNWLDSLRRSETNRPGLEARSVQMLRGLMLRIQVCFSMGILGVHPFAEHDRSE